MYYKLLLLLLFVATTFTTTLAQSQRTEINGRQVEFNSDGTWDYVDEENQEDKMEEKEVQEPIPQIISISDRFNSCLLYTSPSPRDATLSRMPSSA